MKTPTDDKRRRAKRARADLSLFSTMTSAHSRQARTIAYEAALAVIG